MFEKTATGVAALFFLEPARQRAEWWRVPLTLALLLAVYIGFYFTLLVIGRLIFGNQVANNLAASIAVGNSETPESMIFLLVTFFGMFIGIFLSVFLIHQRGLKTLFGPNFGQGLKNFIFATLAVFALFLVLSAVFPNEEKLTANLPLDSWLKWMIVALPLIWIQVTSEELIFRGYLQQQLAVLAPSRLVWWILPSILFGLLHYSPESYGPFAWLVVIQITFVALIAADLTMRTGNLWAAIGLHFGNNILGMALIGIKGMLSGLALYVTPYSLEDIDIVGPILKTELAVFAVIFVIYMFVAHRIDAN